MKPQDSLNNSALSRRSARLQAQQLQSFKSPPSIEPHSAPPLRKYCPECVNNSVTKWVESISGSEFYQRRHCRSDIPLNHQESDSIPRSHIQSAPNMVYAWAAGSALPPIPASTGKLSNAQSFASHNTASSASSSGRSSGRNHVEDPYYRSMNLAANNIYIRSSREQYPEHIACLVNEVRMDLDSPGPSLNEVWQDMALENLEMGTGEPDVEDYFRGRIFAKPAPLDGLKRIDKSPMAKQVVPDIGSKLKISIPVPDMLYGYNRYRAFPQQQAQLISMGTEIAANSQDLIYPFFVIEFKGDGPSGSGSLWVATNQCLGGSVSCINIAERLNYQLRQCKSNQVLPINSAVFSIAMNGIEARLYISWKHGELNYYMQKVESFLLQRPDHYLEFYKYVRNIIHWGKDKRLKEIRKSLNNLLEESRRRASETAKSRPPPSDDSTDSSHKLKASRKRRSSDHN